MPSIFISYRREDCPGHAGRVRDHFRDEFGAERVFMDLDAIPSGSRFSDRIEQAVSSCDAVLVLIGPQWLSVRGREGARRIDEARDWVRHEVSAALRSGKVVVPVLLAGGVMPHEDELPEDIRELVAFQSAEVSDRRWDYDIERLVKDTRSVTQRGDPQIGPAPGMLVSDPIAPATGAVAAAPTSTGTAAPSRASGRWRHRWPLIAGGVMAVAVILAAVLALSGGSQHSSSSTILAHVPSAIRPTCQANAAKASQYHATGAWDCLLAGADRVTYLAFPDDASMYGLYGRIPKTTAFSAGSCHTGWNAEGGFNVPPSAAIVGQIKCWDDNQGAHIIWTRNDLKLMGAVSRADSANTQLYGAWLNAGPS